MIARRLLGLLDRARALVARRRFESELDEEVRFHLDQATARNISRGMGAADAARAARLAFGGVERTKEEVRSETGVRLLQDIGQDVTGAVRVFRRNPAFTVITTATIAVCIAANASVFGIVYGILLKPLPFPESGRLVRIFNSYPAAGEPRAGNSVLAYDDRRAHVPALQHVALYAEESSVLGAGDGSRHTFALRVTPSFFAALGATPGLGRFFDERRTDAGREVVIGHDLWASAFGSRLDVAGTTAVFDGVPSTIVGVLPESFRFSTWNAQVFIPLEFSPADRAESRRHSDRFEMIARLAPGSTVDDAQAQIDALNRARLERYAPELARTVTSAGFRTIVRPYLDDMTRDVARPLWFLWAGVLVVLVIGAANVTSLFLIHTRARARELGTRLALGAGRLRILRQLIAPSREARWGFWRGARACGSSIASPCMKFRVSTMSR